MSRKSAGVKTLPRPPVRARFNIRSGTEDGGAFIRQKIVYVFLTVKVIVRSPSPAGQALDGAAEGANLERVARIVLHLDPERQPDRARRAWETHLARARWIAGCPISICIISGLKWRPRQQPSLGGHVVRLRFQVARRRQDRRIDGKSERGSGGLRWKWMIETSHL